MIQGAQKSGKPEQNRSKASAVDAGGTFSSLHFELAEVELLNETIAYLNQVLGAFEGDPEPSELKGKELVVRLIEMVGR